MQSSLTRIDLKRSKFLVVDDNGQSLDVLLQILAGFRVKETRACRSSAEARNFVVAEKFDLIIIDGEMPNEDGISLTRHIRTLNQQPNFTAPIVLISSHTAADKVMRCRDAGANLVVKKPIAPATLLRRIEWLARSTRQFVMAEAYNGPDRRFKNLPIPDGLQERRADAIALTSSPDRAMSQDEVDSLFG